MKLASILLARAVAWVEPIDLNPKGEAYYPDLVKAIAARYSFQKYPQQLEDFDETKGVVFGSGKIGDCVIEQLVIYTYGILVDTRISTTESKRLLTEGLQWVAKELGLEFKPTMITRWQFASHVTFYSDAPFTAMSPALRRLSDGVSSAVEKITNEKLKYELLSLFVDFDQLSRKHPLGRFSIQRRENTPFSENKYFSDAPLPTDVHLGILEQFELDLSAK